MEEPEVPTEHLHEEMQEHAARTRGWVMQVALSSAITAAIAAVASLKAGHTANEAMIAQIESSDQWNFYQAKSIKAAQLRSKKEILAALGKPATAPDVAKEQQYEQQQEEIKREAEQLALKSRTYLRQHQTLSHSVTFCQLSIAISAMSVLVRKRRLWAVSLVFGAAGIVFLTLGLLGGF
jgi:uncharacterized protein DUF4337